MEVGLAAQSHSFIPAARRGLREGEARTGYRPSHAEPLVSVAYSRLSVLPELAWVAKVARTFGAGFCVQHAASVLFINPSISVSPNKAFKLARFTRWDALSARPLTSR